ncbi:MAG: hypothetical protein WBA57_18490 [Elainellaceae cyanobacterium]
MKIRPESSGTNSSFVPATPEKRSQTADLIQAISAANLPATLVAKQGVTAAISVSDSTLKHYRKHYWLEGIHYIYLGPKTIRYNLQLVVDWAIHKNQPHVHQRAIEAYLARVAQAQSNPRTRKKRS